MDVLKKSFVLLFFVALIIPVVAMRWLPEQTISSGERRTLAARPALELNRSVISEFPKAFEAYLNDHFGYRDELIRLYNFTRVKTGLADKLSNVLIGDDDWLYFGGHPHVRDMRNVWPFDQRQLDDWAGVLNQKSAWLKQAGIHYLFAFVPNKHLIYPEYLPRNLNIADRQSRLDQLLDHLHQNSQAPVLDLREGLFAEKQKEPAPQHRLYYKTDTHWNAYGAYIAYRALIEKLNSAGFDIDPFTADDNAFVQTQGAGDLAGNLGLAQELTSAQVTFRKELATCVQYYDTDKHADLAIKQVTWFSTTCEGKPLRVLMLRDSYSLAMMPYLSETFGYIMYVPHSPAPLSAIQELVRLHKPDIVIEERVSRWLRTPNG